MLLVQTLLLFLVCFFLSNPCVPAAVSYNDTYAVSRSLAKGKGCTPYHVPCLSTCRMPSGRILDLQAPNLLRTLTFQCQLVALQVLAQAVQHAVAQSLKQQWSEHGWMLVHGAHSEVEGCQLQTCSCRHAVADMLDRRHYLWHRSSAVEK
jgi:hypothetical protein